MDAIVEFCHDVLRSALAADTFTYYVAGGLTLVVFFMMRSMLPTKGLSTLCLPFLMFSGLAGPYVLSRAGIFLAMDQRSSTVVSVSIGMLVTMLVLIVVASLVLKLLSLNKVPQRLPEPRRA